MNDEDIKQFNFDMQIDSGLYIWDFLEITRLELIKKGVSENMSYKLMDNVEITIFYNQQNKQVLTARFHSFPKDTYEYYCSRFVSIDLYSVSNVGRRVCYEAPGVEFDLIGKRLMSLASGASPMDEMLGTWSMENNIDNIDFRRSHIIKLIIRNGLQHYICLPSNRELVKLWCGEV